MASIEEKESGGLGQDDQRIRGKNNEAVLEAGAGVEVQAAVEEEVEEEVGEADAKTGGIVVSPVHAQLLAALQSSPLLSAIHVEVRNYSYWYKMRHALGPKRQAACLVKENPNNGLWESSIYKLKARESDGEIVPTKTFLSTHKSRWAAYRKCEASAKERDQNPYETHRLVDPSAILSTHFHLLIVSQLFDRIDTVDRHAMVYEALIAEMGEPLAATLPTTTPCQYAGSYGRNANESRKGGLVPGARESAAGLGMCPPRNLKMGSIFGKNMCNLDLFRVICTQQPLHLLIEARTPSQWKPGNYDAPLSERFGANHLGSQASHVPKEVQGAANKSRLRLLAHVRQAHETGHLESPDKSLGNKSILSLAETLGIDPIASGVKYKRTGGVYGHFFSDLPKVVREMIMTKFVENKKLIQKEGNRHPEEKSKKKKKKDTFQPKTGMSMLRAKLASQLDMADYDKGTNSEAEMMEEVYIAARKFERVAHRLQRIRRGAVLFRAVRIIWWRKYAAITIQRIVRGRYSRMYSALLAKMLPRAVIPLQRRFHNRRSNRLLARWQPMVLRMTRVVMPKMKRFLRNCFLCLTWKLTHNTIVIQSVCRMYIAKVRFVRRKEERRLWSNLLDLVMPYHKAAIQIQRRIRGNVGRRGYAQRIEDMLVKRIDWPRSIKIQKIYRGLLGRRKAAKARYMLKCLLLLQKVIRAFVRRIWDAQLAQAQLEERMATAIQRIVRGRIDRVLVRYIADAHFYKFKYIPAVIYIQSIIRGFHARERVNLIKRQLRGALAMQGCYRHYLARLEFWRKWREAREKFLFSMAQVIQKMIRRFLCWKKYPSLLLANKGRVLMAAKVILRSWVNFKYAKRMQLLLDDNRSSFYAKKLPRFKQAIEEVYEDQKEIQHDIRFTEQPIEKLKARLKALGNFLVEAQMRCAAIEKEIAGLQPEDYERGWGDAFGEEFEVLSRQLKMSMEETRNLKAKLWKLTSERNLLFCELEEVEIELDSLCVSQTEAYEGMRRATVGRIERRVQDSKARKVRIERSKWKTDAVRLNVILRHRKAYQAMLKLVRFFRLTTILMLLLVASIPRLTISSPLQPSTEQGCARHELCPHHQLRSAAAAKRP